MKTHRQFIIWIFIFLNVSAVIGQNNFVIKGSIINEKTKAPVDSSIYVTIFSGKGIQYKSYCNHNGSYSIQIPDSLSGREISVRASQDQTNLEKHKISSPSEPCTFTCLDNKLFGTSDKKKLFLNSDSTKEYAVNFQLYPIIIDYSCPSIYFKKNELTMVQSDYYLTADSALCFFKNLLNCRKSWVFEVAGNCSPREKNRNELSSKRAELVKNKFVELGINPSRIVAKGYSDKSYRRNKFYVKKNRKIEGDNRPSYINKKDYEWQTVTISLLRSDFE